MGTTILGISKTSIQGALGLIITIALVLTSIQIPSSLATPEVTHIWLWVTTILAVVAAVARAVVGFLQGDAPMPAAKP
jgi:hypothetical protein